MMAASLCYDIIAGGMFGSVDDLNLRCVDCWIVWCLLLSSSFKYPEVSKTSLYERWLLKNIWLADWLSDNPSPVASVSVSLNGNPS